MRKLADLIRRRLEEAIQAFPVEFFDGFDYTRTGNNLTHPLILGELVRIACSFSNVRHVGVDVRLNTQSGIKFQPDLVAFNRAREPLFFIDYESPNSSDARIPIKDIAAYRGWRSSGGKAPYLIMTTLPDCQAPTWELRWTAKGQYNEVFRGQRAKVRAMIRENPFQFWRSFWKRSVAMDDLTDIVILNIDRRNVRRVRIM